MTTLIILREGRPVGIVTERDFISKVVAKEVNPSTIKVSNIMSTPLVTIDPDEDLLKAAQTMKEHGVRKLPVVQDGIIYGIIKADDIADKCGEYVDRSVKDIIRWTPLLGL